SEGVQMRIVVDLNRCQGYVQCCFLAPGVVELHGEEALWYDPAPDAAQRDHVRAPPQRVPCRRSSLNGRRRPASSKRRSRMRSNGSGPAFEVSGRIAIVGASLAGLSAAETLRAECFRG